MCFLRVHSADLALAFYRDAPGLELRNDVANEGFRWITVDAASRPGVAMVLTNYPNDSSADGEAVAALLAKGAQDGVDSNLDDLDATFEKVDNSGSSLRSRM